MSDRTVPRLRTNFLWALTGNAVYMGCQWGMLVALAKLTDPETVGTFALGLAVASPVVTFFNMELRGIQATDATREHPFTDYLGLRVIAASASLLIVFLIAGFSGYRGETAAVILAIGVWKAVDSISDIFYGLFQQRERLYIVAASMMMKGPASLLVLSGIVYLTGSVVWAVAGLIGASIATLLLYDARRGAATLGNPPLPGKAGRLARFFGRDGALRAGGNSLWRLALTAFPVAVVVLLLSLATNIPRYFVEHHLGIRNLGIFAALAYLILAGGGIVGALGQSASPRLAAYFADRNLAGFIRLLVAMLAAAIFLGVSGILASTLAGEEILTIFYRKEYSEHAGVFVLLMVAAAVSYINGTLGAAVTATRHFRIQVPIHALNLTVILGCSALLIKPYGLAGAAWTMLIGATFLTVAYAATLARILRSRQLPQ